MRCDIHFAKLQSTDPGTIQLNKTPGDAAQSPVPPTEDITMFYNVVHTSPSV
jgi:hypothetical protein